MMACGGVLGAIIASILTESFNPAYSFLGTAWIGCLLCIACCFLNKEIEMVDIQEADANKTVW